MTGRSDEKESISTSHRRVHLANERTFLSWVRTSIGIMAFGFVVEKFTLFVRQITFFLGRAGHSPEGLPAHLAPPGWSSIFGILLVGLGPLIGILAFIRYKGIERQINEDVYRPSLRMDILLILSISGMGVFLILYLIHSL